MPHKETEKALVKSAPRRQRRGGGFRLGGQRRTEKVKPLAAVRAGYADSVFVVKVETRDGAQTGHPLVIPPALAVEECYRTRDKARDAMRELARCHAASEVAGSRGTATPALLNCIPAPSDDAEHIEVVTRTGFLVRYFIDELPLR